jgi:ketosteroid isomerase-like protein
MDDRDSVHVREAVKRGMASLEAAERSLDTEGLLEHFFGSTDFYLYNDGQRVTFEAMAQGVRQAFPTLSKLDGGFTDVDTHVLAADAALVTAQFREIITTGGGAVVRQRGVASWLWRLREGQWRIACGHVDHYPDNPQPAA